MTLLAPLLLAASAFAGPIVFQSTEDQACRRSVDGLVSQIAGVRYTCTSRCSKENLWLGFAAGSGPTAQDAYDALAGRCEAARMSVVNSQLSCKENYWRASFHEDLDKDCPARKAVLEKELTFPRMRCTAKLYGRGDTPYYATVDAANAAAAWVVFSSEAERRDFSFGAFAPGADCGAVPQ